MQVQVVFMVAQKILPLMKKTQQHILQLYAATKRSNELMAHAYSYLFSINTIGLRFFTVYGPWSRPDMSLYTFAKNIIDGKPIKIFNVQRQSYKRFDLC